jgi:hypothetical protein
MAGDDRAPVRPLWPWAFPTGSRHVRVVGPTEALRGRAGGPGMAVPPGAVAGLLDPAQRSSWQLAQEVWQESGVTWERTTPENADVEPAAGWFPAYAPPNTGFSDSEPAYFEPSDREPAATAWHADLESGGAEPADPERATVGLWPAGHESGDAELGAPDEADFGRTTAGPWPRGPEPGAPDSAGFEPVADDEWSAGPGAEGVRPAETWFTGVGPADTRVAPAKPRLNSTRPEPIGADLARDDALRLGAPEHPGRLGSGQAGRAQQPGSAWNEYPPTGFPGQAWPAGSGRVPLGAPVMLDPQAAESVGLAEPLGAGGPDGAEASGWVGGAALSEPDELFRAWQGSVNEAAAARGSWSVPRRAASASRRRRALQAAAIGVPVAIIVTVGAGAFMMLTGKANEMLAVRADAGAPSPAATATGTSATRVGARPSAGSVPPAFAGGTLPGYPGQRGAVTVASMMTAAGVTLAVGTADGHPSIWRRAANGSWTLESTASLGAVTGSAGLTSIAHGPAGWIAVGATSDGGATVPVVLASADGVQWQPVTALATRAEAGTEFLGAAAGRSGYVVVGRQMVGGRTFAVLWYSADLRSWIADDNGGLDGRLEASTANAIAATADGFVAVGSHGAAQSMWTSSDGRHWQLGSVPAPAGASSATLRSVAASGTRVVAAGYAATRAGDIPVAVVSTDGGGQWRQIVLQSPDGLGVITALTAAPDGFTAAGVVGRSGSQQAVTWTSADGLTWSRPAQTAGSEITAIAVVGTTVAGTAEQGAGPTLVALPAPLPA